MISSGRRSAHGSRRLHACNQVEFRSLVRGTFHGRYEGTFIGGSRDSKYDLHRHVVLPLQLSNCNNRDDNPLCISILILGDRRHEIFVYFKLIPGVSRGGARTFAKPGQT